MVKNRSQLVIGILALQGAFDLHVDMLRAVAQQDDSQIDVVFVKRPADLNGIDGIILPGGESTVMEKLLKTSGVGERLEEQIVSGLPVFGTCAGLILLANYFSVLDCVVERNSYGTQINSVESEVELVPNGETCRAFFIRAPKILSVGDEIEVLAKRDGEIVGVARENVLGIACHPEVAGSMLFHQFFVDIVARRVKSSA